MSYAEMIKTAYADGPSVDAFGRARVSNPTTIFESNFVHDKQPLLFEEDLVNGATSTHDAANSCIRLATTGVGSQSALIQSFVRPPYNPGKSHLVEVTFNFKAGVAGVVKEAGIGDDDNSITIVQNGTGLELKKITSSDAPDETVTQANWNLDKMDGTGPSGITIDQTKAQIFALDMQWLGVGRVRAAFNIGGNLYPIHEFTHANEQEFVYLNNLILPIRWKISSTAATSSFDVICSTIQSEGGRGGAEGYRLVPPEIIELTAANGARTHAVSIRPKATFNGVKNKTDIRLRSIKFLNTDAAPAYYEVVVGANLTGTTTYNDVDTAYSAVEYNTAGTFNALNGPVIEAGFIGSVDKSFTPLQSELSAFYPLTLDNAGNPRELGTLTILVQGIGATATVRVVLEWAEAR